MQDSVDGANDASSPASHAGQPGPVSTPVGDRQISDNFITRLIDSELSAGQHSDGIITRFPPEPNGFLHIGHAKSICLNFGLAERYPGASCNLRFDDTNPGREEQRYIDAIMEDVRWLGFQWAPPVRYASTYFPQLYSFALGLIEEGYAYICSLPPEEITRQRGTLTSPGVDSPWRDRPWQESLDLFKRMRAGEFADGAHVLRARIDMRSPNMNMRDPILYRIRHAHHHQTGDQWCIYPMYDYTHPISDALEGITHSLCTLEFEDHRPLYDWVIEHTAVAARPRQTEFSRLRPNYMVTSKRKLRRMVEEGYVDGWDDPRMPTLAGLRRRGYTPASIRAFCDAAGVSRSEGITDVAMLEHAIRDDLNRVAPRAMCVRKPLRVTLTNWNQADCLLEAPVHPQQAEMGTRPVQFSGQLLIDQEDFKETANKHFKRLVLGKEVRLRYAYVIRCDEVLRDPAGEISELRCTVDHDTLGKDPEGRKVKGVIHWVSAVHAVPVELRNYDRLFNVPLPDGDRDEDFVAHLNPASLEIENDAMAESVLADSIPGQAWQFEREGYYVRDSQAGDKLVFNRTVTLRDTWERKLG